MTDDELITRALEVLQRRSNATGAPALTVAELYARYWAASCKRKSWRTMEIALRRFVAEHAGRAVESLRVLDWSDFRSAQRKTLSAATMNLHLGWVKAMLSWGVGEGRIAYNPLASAKREKTRKHRETAPSERDIGQLLEHTGSAQRVVALCAVDAGMRCSEIRSLSWDWLERDAGVIRLPNWACKGERGGPVPMTKRLLEAIDAMPRALRSPWVLTSPRPDSPDGRYDRRTLSRWWRAAADAAGIQAAPGDGKVRLHDGRHGFATNAVRRAVRIETVSEMLRHASLAMTQSYVQGANADDLRDAREAFERGIERDRRR